MVRLGVPQTVRFAAAGGSHALGDVARQHVVAEAVAAAGAVLCEQRAQLGAAQRGVAGVRVLRTTASCCQRLTVTNRRQSDQPVGCSRLGGLGQARGALDVSCQVLHDETRARCVFSRMAASRVGTSCYTTLWRLHGPCGHTLSAAAQSATSFAESCTVDKPSDDSSARRYVTPACALGRGCLLV